MNTLKDQIDNECISESIAELKRDNQLLSYDVATLTDRLRAAGL